MQDHMLVVTLDKAVPTEVSKEHQALHLDPALSHEEAGILFTQHTVHLTKDPDSRICMVCNNSDVLALRVYFCLTEKIQYSLTM